MTPLDLSDRSQSKPAFRAISVIGILLALVYCAYAGGQTRRPGASTASARRSPVDISAIRGRATTGRAAKAGPSANVGQSVTVVGMGFDDNVSVQFTAFANSTFSIVPLKVKNRRAVVAVPGTVVTGGVRLIDPEAGTSEPRVLQIVPKIDTMTPEAVAPQGRLLIDGSGFTHDAKVTFRGVSTPVVPTVVSPSRIDIVVPAGAQPGKVTVITDGGTSKPAKLSVLGAAKPEPAKAPPARPRKTPPRR